MNEQVDIEDNGKKPHIFTTGDMMHMLRQKYATNGEHVILFDVPDVVGTQSKRRADAIAVGMWGSTGRLVHGFEIKASRSDWLREVKQVDKADPFIKQCDRFWLVTGSVTIVKPEEIPLAWGWMSATKSGLRVQKPAQPLAANVFSIERLFAFALLRCAARRGDDNPEFALRLREIREQNDRRVKDIEATARASVSSEYARLRERVDKFEKSSGMKLDDWRLGDVGKLARIIAELKITGYHSIERTLASQVAELERLLVNTKAAAQTLPAALKELSTGDEL